MERPKCAVKTCKKDAFVAYGNSWICGDCMYKIILKKQDEENKLIEELEI